MCSSAVLFLGLVAVVLSGPADPSHISGRIVGGVEWEGRNAPYIVSLRYNLVHFCGGSIVAKNYIVTAAHCVYGIVSTQYHTVHYNFDAAGTIYRSFVQMDYIVKHPFYHSPSTDFDVAFVGTKEEFQFGVGIHSAIIPIEPTDIPENGKFLVVGWGAIIEGGLGSNKLMAVNLTKISNEKCKNLYNESSITERMFCGLDPGKDACQGDSGGPAVYRNKLVGIVSWGNGCARPYYPGVYTRIADDLIIRFIRTNGIP